MSTPIKTITQRIIDVLEKWEEVKEIILSAGKDWQLTPDEISVLWSMRQDAINYDMPYSVIDRFSRLFDRH
jgi:hypothetical protein